MKCKDEHVKNRGALLESEFEDKNERNRQDPESHVKTRSASSSVLETGVEMSHINETITRREDEISSDYDSVLWARVSREFVFPV